MVAITRIGSGGPFYGPTTWHSVDKNDASDPQARLDARDPNQAHAARRTELSDTDPRAQCCSAPAALLDELSRRQS